MSFPEDKILYNPFKEEEYPHPESPADLEEAKVISGVLNEEGTLKRRIEISKDLLLKLNAVNRLASIYKDQAQLKLKAVNEGEQKILVNDVSEQESITTFNPEDWKGDSEQPLPKDICKPHRGLGLTLGDEPIEFESFFITYESKNKLLLCHLERGRSGTTWLSFESKSPLIENKIVRFSFIDQNTGKTIRTNFVILHIDDYDGPREKAYVGVLNLGHNYLSRLIQYPCICTFQPITLNEITSEQAENLMYSLVSANIPQKNAWRKRLKLIESSKEQVAPEILQVLQEELTE